MRIDFCVVAIPLLRVDVPSSSQCIRFCSEFSGAETDDEIEAGEVLRPPGLPAGEEFGRGEVLQILVVSYYIDRKSGAFKVVSPNFESGEDGQEFLIMSVVVQLRGGESLGVERYGVDFTIVGIS